jgi:hypothetical protein
MTNATNELDGDHNKVIVGNKWNKNKGNVVINKLKQHPGRCFIGLIGIIIVIFSISFFPAHFSGKPDSNRDSDSTRDVKDTVSSRHTSWGSAD